MYVVPEMLLIGIEMANDYGVGFFFHPIHASVIVVYLSDEILFPCARARLLHELRWLRPLFGLLAFDPFIRSVFFLSFSFFSTF